MIEQQENALGAAASAYLRSARYQPVQWNEWGAEPFDRAKRENKPVLLDIGAVWCHWCHVMDRESYENETTAALINERFVAVKVDRDERPDVDTRYQAAVAAISGQGGWPLTAFLTPEGKPYFGGTYFPSEERYGRPSFIHVLHTMADAFDTNRDDVEETGGSVLEAIEHNESFSGHAGVIGTGQGRMLLEKLIAAAVSQFDERNGGFGSQPKFPHSSVLDLLIDAAGRGDEAAKNVVDVTLTKMASGGIYDQLAGGFHRYSVDERWVVPHFEKMAYDNSELLKDYAHAYQMSGDKKFAHVAEDILRWMDECLSDREPGGFFASQDADDSLDDDGDYYTWTRDEAAAVLSVEEFEASVAFYNLRAVGDMHHNPQKNVLHRVGGFDQVAKSLGMEAGVASGLMRSVRAKMYAARLLRKTPYVDKTMYTGWNGMCISAYIAAGRALGNKEPVAFALKSMDRLLAAAWSVEVGMAHVITYGEGTTAKRVSGVLEDYAFVANAALDAWEASGELRYFTVAESIASALLVRFCDTSPGDAMSHGFFDIEADPKAIGALSTRRKPLQDSPTPAGNAVAAELLLRLYTLTGNEMYRSRAEDTLETFAGVVEHLGLYVASYGLALRLAVETPLQVCVIGDDLLAEELERAAVTPFAVSASVIRLRREQLSALPPALSETLPHLPMSVGSVAVVCRAGACLPPMSSVEELKAALGLPVR